MIAFKSLPNIYVVITYCFFATTTSTEVAHEQSKKGSFLRRIFGKKEGPTTKPHEATGPEKSDISVHTETAHLLMFPLEWYLLPYPINRKYLLKALPFDLAKRVPEDCDEPIEPAVEERIREFFLFSV